MKYILLIACLTIMLSASGQEYIGKNSAFLIDKEPVTLKDSSLVTVVVSNQNDIKKEMDNKDEEKQCPLSKKEKKNKKKKANKHPMPKY